MIRLIRNAALRLCIAAAAGIPLLLVLLPLGERVFPGMNPMAAAGVVFPGLYLVSGYAMGFAARKRIAAIVREAETWTRAGIYQRAHRCYVKGLRIYDSFLLSPWQSEKTARRLSGAMARFSLVAPVSDPCFDRAVTAFLLKEPFEEEIALLWLKKLCNTQSLDPLDHELLSRLAGVDVKNPRITTLLADIFLELNITDFAARKVYQTVLNNSLADSTTRTLIQELLDEQENISPEGRFFSPGPQPDPPKEPLVKTVKTSAAKGMRLGAELVKTVWILGKKARTGLLFWIGFVKQRPGARLAVKGGLALAAGALLVIFMVNTISHLMPGEVPAKKKTEIPLETAKPFTIQVAAYLKKKHAGAYVARLTEKGLNAHQTRAVGGGKTWYLVRVASFPDKKSAAEYGRQLKKRGIINDFFVDNK
ncbi:MAG TPA: SPOR domain-containing protein, partial [Desulfobacteraceae bacterium]|nr:SPOR domain-containing protein [Desulfobacteraceae bacterium]